MRTVQMTLDEALVEQVDEAAKTLNTTRSEFTRQALREALRKKEIQDMEARHRAAYARKPLKTGEFAVWEKIQAWGDP